MTGDRTKREKRKQPPPAAGASARRGEGKPTAACNQLPTRLLVTTIGGVSVGSCWMVLRVKLSAWPTCRRWRWWVLPMNGQ